MSRNRIRNTVGFTTLQLFVYLMAAELKESIEDQPGPLVAGQLHHPGQARLLHNIFCYTTANFTKIYSIIKIRKNTHVH